MLKVNFENTKKLLKVLSSMENVIRKNQNASTLKCIKLENLNGKLHITAVNPYMRLEYTVEETNKIEGNCNYYDYRKIISLLNVIDGKVSIDNETIKSDKCKYKILFEEDRLYVDDIIPEITNFKEVDAEEFKQAISDVICATSKREYEKILSSVYINKDTLVGCDSNRIFMKKIDTELDNAIISREFVNELARLPFEDKIKMSTFGKKVIFRDEYITVSCDYVEGEYPKYENILPVEPIQTISFKKQDLEKAINLVNPIIDEDTNVIELSFKGKKVIVRVDNGTDLAETDFKIEENAKDIKVKFNAVYLLDMLKANKEETIIMKQYGTSTGFGFEAGKAKQYIMPMVN